MVDRYAWAGVPQYGAGGDGFSVSEYNCSFSFDSLLMAAIQNSLILNTAVCRDGCIAHPCRVGVASGTANFMAARDHKETSSKPDGGGSKIFWHMEYKT